MANGPWAVSVVGLLAPAELAGVQGPYPLWAAFCSWVLQITEYEEAQFRLQQAWAEEINEVHQKIHRIRPAMAGGNATPAAPVAHPAARSLGSYHETGEIVPSVNFEWGVVIARLRSKTSHVGFLFPTTLHNSVPLSPGLISKRARQPFLLVPRFAERNPNTAQANLTARWAG